MMTSVTALFLRPETAPLVVLMLKLVQDFFVFRYYKQPAIQAAVNAGLIAIVGGFLTLSGLSSESCSLSNRGTWEVCCTLSATIIFPLTGYIILLMRNSLHAGCIKAQIITTLMSLIFIWSSPVILKWMHIC